KGDRVVAMEALAPEGDVFTIAERGYGKRTEVGEYARKGRGGLGVINFRVTAKTGPVIAVRQVAAADELILISQEGKILRTPVDAFRVIGRSTQGVKIMDLGPEDKLVAAAKLVEREEEDGEEPVAELEEIVDQPTAMSEEGGPGGGTELEVAEEDAEGGETEAGAGPADEGEPEEPGS
ncbi:MAG TPA: DNA gyrase C-terminal beta-propeller domain-containing protein, partial [Thermoanaerobaculia bacterium]